MAEFVELVKLAPSSLLVAVLVFGVAPGFALRLIVTLYPRDHPRRRELVAELYTLRRVERLLFVGEALEVALFDGLLRQVSDRRARRREEFELLSKIYGPMVARLLVWRVGSHESVTVAWSESREGEPSDYLIFIEDRESRFCAPIDSRIAQRMISDGEVIVDSGEARELLHECGINLQSDILADLKGRSFAYQTAVHLGLGTAISRGCGELDDATDF